MKRTTAALALLVCAGCDPFHTSFDDVEQAVFYEADQVLDAPETPSVLTVMTWNIKFGGGRIDFFYDCYDDRVLMTNSEVRGNMEAVAAKIRQVDPDLLILNEVDVESKRSTYLDELQFVLNHTDLNYGVYGSAWKADFVPSDGLGRINMGNGILSRWPIAEARRIQLPLIADQDGLTQYFYLKRSVLSARIPVAGIDDFHVVATHTAAFAGGDTKKSHIDRFEQELNALTDQGVLWVAGGDLNVVPRGTVQVKDFPDAICPDEGRFAADDYSDQVDLLDGLYAAYESAIPLTDYQADNAPYFSFTSDKNGFWNRKLDYLFTDGAFAPGSGLVHQNESSGGVATMPLSDHAPVSVTLELP